MINKMSVLIRAVRLLRPSWNGSMGMDNDGTISSWGDDVNAQPTQAEISGVMPSAIMMEMKGILEDAIQKHLDDTAKVRGYDGILSVCTYATSSNATFKAEGLAAVAWRDAVWAHCYTVLAAVQAGTRQIPTEAALIAELPAMVW